VTLCTANFRLLWHIPSFVGCAQDEGAGDDGWVTSGGNTRGGGLTTNRTHIPLLTSLHGAPMDTGVCGFAEASFTPVVTKDARKILPAHARHGRRRPIDQHHTGIG
jgi:hypothetical protein